DTSSTVPLINQFIMAFLHVAFLFMLTWNKLAAESEHVSINVPGDVPSISAAEAMRIPEEVEVEENLPMMFSRASQPARYKYGGGAYSRKQQKAIVNLHNEYRRNVSPAPSDMSEMLWSPKLAAQAQAWSDRCVYAHPDKTQHPDYEGIGQNLYIKYLDTGGKSPPSPATDPVTKWYDEVKDFHYDYNQ
ncbi:CAP domain-containing protein, partial [Salmonella sp. s55004]|uniref:CAP domain-containing protein n=1 Tax=Salmonella sp. s55004 TaxID=3159675 RepID=UPI00397F8382